MAKVFWQTENSLQKSAKSLKWNKKNLYISTKSQMSSWISVKYIRQKFMEKVYVKT